jgi:HSP20 family molecular chaperone IbpA
MNGNKKATQCACYTRKDREGRVVIEVELPSAKKKAIPLHLSEGPFHVTPRFIRG